MSMTISSLQKAIYQQLNSDHSVTSLIGLDQIFDHQIRNVERPYIVFSDWQVNDWSTSDENGEEHEFSIEIWHQDGGRKNSQDMARVIIRSLHGNSLSLEFGHLVNLRFENILFRFETNLNLQMVRLNFRAVIEY